MHHPLEMKIGSDRKLSAAKEAVQSESSLPRQGVGSIAVRAMSNKDGQFCCSLEVAESAPDQGLTLMPGPTGSSKPQDKHGSSLIYF